MVEENEHYAYFTVTGNFDPATITARIGVVPTECWQRGDIHPETRYERTFSRWSLYSRLDRDQALEAHIADVLEQLDAKAEAFAAVSREFGGIMQLVGYFWRYYPGLHFEPQMTEHLARYSLGMDCDFYGLYSHTREDT